MVMRRLLLTSLFASRGWLLFGCLTVAACGVLGQTVTKPSPAIIGGTVTIDGEPAANIVVTLRTTAANGVLPRTVAKGRTGADGRYQLSSLVTGDLALTPQAPAFIITDLPDRKYNGEPGILVSLDDGEVHKDVDFTLQRGGVISGRITSADGRAAVACEVHIQKLFAEAHKPPDPAYFPEVSGPFPWTTRTWTGNDLVARTDDRGIYRFFGVPPGRYSVSAGGRRSWSGGTPAPFYYQQVYFPATPTAEEASLIDISSGSEAKNIDITLGERRNDPTFQASGRVINYLTRKPVTSVEILADPLPDADGTSSGGNSQPATMTESGEFILTGLRPGRYQLRTFGDSSEGVDYATVEFTVSNADVDGLKIESSPGLSLGGRLVIENTSNDALPFRWDELYLSISSEDRSTGASSNRGALVRPDGSFKVGGLRPGRVYLGLYYRGKGIGKLSVERGGIRLRGDDPIRAGGLTLEAGDQIDGLLVTAVYGNCIVRGLVKRSRESWPDSTEIKVNYWRNDDTSRVRFLRTDGRGRFLVEGLTPGEYTFEAEAFLRGDRKSGTYVCGSATVNVTNGVETTVNLTVVEG